MKKTSSILLSGVWLIFLCLLTAAQDFRQVRDGIEYAETTRQIDNQPVKINLLRLDLRKVRLDVVHALDSAIGLETTSSMAIRHGAFAAINAGFFRLDRSIFAGDAQGVLIIDGRYFSESYDRRTALRITNEKEKTIIEFIKENIKPSLRIGNEYLEISGINRERKMDELILYTPEFNRTTLTDKNGLEILIEKGKAIRIFDGKGSSIIPDYGFVVSASGKYRKELLGKVKIGQKILMVTAMYPFIVEDIVGGVPQLIKNGRVEITWEEEKASKSFVETKHPRTAVAKLKDGKFLLVTVDGRQEHSAGINLQNLAEILLEHGATDAMNLDGGGSTTMFLDGKVVNKPSDKEGERKVSDAILIFPRKK